MKIAVVGGGSTYTPELVSGLRAASRSTRLALHDIDSGAARGRRRAGRADARRAGLRRRALVAGELDARARRRRLRPRPDPGRRPGGAAARRDRPARLRLHRPGDDRRGRASRRRCGRCRSCSRSPSACASWPGRTRGSSTSRTRSGSSPGRCSTPGTARSGSATSRSRFQRRFAALLGVEPARVVVDQVGLNHLTWVRGVRLDGDDVLPELLEEHGDELADGGRSCRAGCSRSSARCPSYYLRYFYEHDAVLAEQLDGVPRADDGRRDRARAARAVPRSRRSNEKPALLEQRGGAFYSEAAAGLVRVARRPTRRRPRGRRAQRRHAGRARGRRRRRGAGAGRRRADRAAAAARRSRPSCSGSSSTSPRTSGWRRRRRSRGTR